MTRFAPGHRVIVRDDNDYDKPAVSETFGPMAGHYGKVIKVRHCRPLVVDVEILGHITGQESPAVAGLIDGQPDRVWIFYEHELEHAD